MDEVFELNQFAIEDLLPDVTLYFDLSPEIGLARINIDKDREINRLDFLCSRVQPVVPWFLWTSIRGEFSPIPRHLW